jgi:hypothetical protein
MSGVLTLIYHCPSLLVELLALLAALNAYRKEKSSETLFFSFFLLATNIIEWGSALKLFVYHNSNNWIFNLFNPLEFGFYAWLYYTNINNTQSKRHIRMGLCIVWVSYLVNILFGQGFWFLDSYTYILGSVFIVYVVFLYYKNLLENLETVTTDIIRTRLFLISIGLFIFYGCETFLMAFFQYFLITKKFSVFYPAWSFLSITLNIILYSFIFISFWRKPRPRDT